MATVRLLGPISWVQPQGQNGLLPDQSHVWAIEIPGGGSVFSVSVHPTKDYAVQALAVESLSTAYAREGNPAVNFIVHNVSINGVGSYRMFISVIDF